MHVFIIYYDGVKISSLHEQCTTRSYKNIMHVGAFFYDGISWNRFPEL